MKIKIPDTQSYSQLGMFLDCRRMYWYHYVDRLRIDLPNMNFVVGRVIEYGVYLIYARDKNAVKKTVKYLNKEKMELRKKYPLGQYEEQMLSELESIVRGMLISYKTHHKDFIKSAKHIKNELTIKVKIGGGKFVVKLDNILKVNGKYYVHELKTAKTVNQDYVKNIQNDFQSHIYFYITNASKKIKLSGIIYDVIRKPSIRRKKDESPDQFVYRLSEWYNNPDTSNVFYMSELDEKPLIPKKNIFNVVKKTMRDIVSCKTEDDFYHNYKFCYIWGRCDYYPICILGEECSHIVKEKRK